MPRKAGGHETRFNFPDPCKPDICGHPQISLPSRSSSRSPPIPPRVPQNRDSAPPVPPRPRRNNSTHVYNIDGKRITIDNQSLSHYSISKNFKGLLAKSIGSPRLLKRQRHFYLIQVHQRRNRWQIDPSFRKG